MSGMEKRDLGKTGLRVTALGYGAMELRLVGEQREATRLLNAVLDGGINYIDTSPDYGPSEAYIGKAIAHRRSEYFLASKCGCNIDETGKHLDPTHVWSKEQLLRNIENSLRLLKTDHLDVWQLHGPLPSELPGGRSDTVIQTMQDLKRQGKVRYIGISFKNGRAGEELYPAGYGKYLPEFAPWGVFDVVQVVYGGLTRRNENVIARTAEQGIGMIIRGVVKKYRDNYDELFKQAKLDELCADGESQNAFLIRFALSHPGVSTMIIGTKDLDHLAANIQAAANGKLPDDVYRKAKLRLDAIGIAAEK
jgi:aryl-alcohol dehydrogenase-like predicted oxidoreductase